MPSVRNAQAAVVHGRVQRTHCGVKSATDQCRYRKRERHRETDVAHVEHRRMDDHAGILQQRIQVVTLCRHRKQAIEWI